MAKSRKLFKRYEGNPILTPKMWPYPLTAVLNPAAVKFNSQTFLLVRAVDYRDLSHLSLAISENGETNWQIDDKPTIEPDLERGEFILEDPRIVWMEELKKFIIVCVSSRTDYKEKPFGIMLLGTKDFSKFERISMPLQPENKNASLFPRRIGDRFALIHRPIIAGKSYIAVAFSPDLKHWGDDRPLFTTRQWLWDSYKIGLGCPPIETEKGWLIIYHGSGEKAHKLIYRVGLALLHPEKLDLTHRTEEWVFGPRESYEGGEYGIVFPCGAVLDEKTKELKVYHGENDSAIGLATANLDELLEVLMKCPVS